MKIKPILNAVEVAANLVIVGTAAKSLYNKFSSSSEDDDDEDEDQTDKEDNEDTED